MINRVYIPYIEADQLIEEGDVLLFRSTGFIASFIKGITQSEYSHVAIASRHNGNWEVVEFREWFGGRVIDFENYLKLSKESKTEIDIYRPCPHFSKLVFNKETKEVEYSKVKYNGKEITSCMRDFTGLPYSYKRIWLILKIHLFRIHVLNNLDKITNELPSKELIYPVCSTIAAHCFAKKGYPIIKNKSDQYTEPAHFATSPRLNYLFTPTI